MAWDKLNLGWKTISGTLLSLIGYLNQAEVLTMLPPKLAAIVTAAGILLAAFGVRVAIAKGPQAAAAKRAPTGPEAPR